jgi:hypothetical protein
VDAGVVRTLRRLSAVALGLAALLPFVGSMRGAAMVVRKDQGGSVVVPYDPWLIGYVDDFLIVAACACVVVRRSRTPRRAALYAALAAVLVVRLVISLGIGTARFLALDADHTRWPSWAGSGSLSLGPAYYGAATSIALGVIGVATAWAGRRSRPGAA